MRLQEGRSQLYLSSCVDQSTTQAFRLIQFAGTDPVVIMAILHPTEDKVLLGRQKVMAQRILLS